MAFLYDTEKLRNRLQCLEDWKIFAFGLLLVERMAPNFYAYQFEGDSSGGWNLRKALAELWRQLEDGFDPDGIGTLIEDIQSIAPDTELFYSDHVSSALDAVSGCINLLKYCCVKDIKLIIECGELMHDSIYVFIGNKLDIDQNSTSFDDAIQKHKITVSELLRQEESLIFLSEIASRRELGWREVLKYSVRCGGAAPLGA
jgi:uncharacterized protein YjaG (DUF416 family)